LASEVAAVVADEEGSAARAAALMPKLPASSTARRGSTRCIFTSGPRG
jgi:hypothetical protein